MESSKIPSASPNGLKGQKCVWFGVSLGLDLAFLDAD
ncbi:Uncharacterised protein [Corynebacterium diphtheriae]|nr:Uncharacterised protein [Corynebacterium diphtheriae]